MASSMDQSINCVSRAAAGEARGSPLGAVGALGVLGGQRGQVAVGGGSGAAALGDCPHLPDEKGAGACSA